MKFIQYLFFLFLTVPAFGQIGIEEIVDDLPCENFFVVSRNPFTAITGPGFPLILPAPVECILPEDSQGRSKLSATLINLGNFFTDDSILDQINELGACANIKFKVIGGSIVEANGDPIVPGATNEYCFQFAGPNALSDPICSASNCGGFGGETETAQLGNFHSGTVWIQWDEDLHDPSKEYGVDVSLEVKGGSVKGKLCSKIVLASGLEIKLCLNLSAEKKKILCKQFIPLGVNTRDVLNTTPVEPSLCVGGGARSVDVLFSPEIVRSNPTQVCSGTSASRSDYRVVWQRKIGGQAWETVTPIGNVPSPSTFGLFRITIGGLTIDRPHSIRMLTYYGTMLADEEEWHFDPVQGQIELVGESDLYASSGGFPLLSNVYGVSGPVAGVTWTVDPPEFAALLTPAAGGTVILNQGAYGGVVILTATGTATNCGNAFSVHKEICIHNLPAGPNNQPCSMGLLQDDTTAEYPAGNNSMDGIKPTPEMFPIKLNTPTTGNTRAKIYPNPLNKGQYLNITVPLAWKTLYQNNLSVSIASLTGQVLSYHEGQLQIGGTTEIAMSTLASGIYLVQIMDQGRVIYSDKIVITD
ncbi:MAG: T9SS type A sorting domain-containing protein [Bacteroidota bacterium]